MTVTIEDIDGCPKDMTPCAATSGDFDPDSSKGQREENQREADDATQEKTGNGTSTEQSESAVASTATKEQSPRPNGDSASDKVQRSPSKKDNGVAEVVNEMTKRLPLEIESRLRRWTRHRNPKKNCKFDVDGFNRWKRKMGIDVNQKIFVVDSVFPDFKQELLDRGWIQNVWDPDGPWFDLKWTVRKQDIDYENLAPPQLANHFEKTAEITTKAGLQKHLKEASDLNEYDIDSWYPRTYHLCSPDELNAFAIEFKIHKAEGILKEFVQQKNARAPSSDTFPEDVVRTALATTKRRLVDIDALLDEEENEGVMHGFWITDDEWAVLDSVDFKNPGQENKNMSRFKEEYYENERMKEIRAVQEEEALKRRVAELQRIQEKFQEKERKKAALSRKNTVWKRPSLEKAKSSFSSDAGGSGTTVTGTGSTASPSKSSGSSASSREPYPGAWEPQDSFELLKAVKDVISSLKAMFPQFSLAGSRNTWVLKPHARARGEGIWLSANLEEINSWCEKHKMSGSWICQKYLESPFLVDGRKNDIRQWVVVTSWNPLIIHFFSKSYIRLAADEFSLSDISNKYGHVSNNNITEHHPEYDAEDDRFCFAMNCKEYRDEMKKRFGFDAYKERVVPAMKQIVIQSLSVFQECLCESAGVKCSFEMLGFDFMVDSDLNVWLIEINSSPSMAYATPVHRALVPQVMREMARVVIGGEIKNPEAGYFECIHDSTDVFSSHKTSDALSGLKVQGQQLLPPEPEKPEVQLIDEETMRERRENELQALVEKMRLKKEKEMKKHARRERILKGLRKGGLMQCKSMSKRSSTERSSSQQEVAQDKEDGTCESSETQNDSGAGQEIECGKPSDALEALLLSTKKPTVIVDSSANADVPASPVSPGKETVKAGGLVHLPPIATNTCGTPVLSASSGLVSPKRFLQEQGAAIISTSSSR
jgi:tubulin monoglycylase TTLL3/8